MKIDYFTESIVVYDLKVGWCIQINKKIKLNELQSSRTFFDLGRKSSKFPNLNFFFSHRLLGYLEPKLV